MFKFFKTNFYTWLHCTFKYMVALLYKEHISTWIFIKAYKLIQSPIQMQQKKIKKNCNKKSFQIWHKKMIFPKLCKCTCQYVCTVQTMCLPAGDVSRTAQYFRLLKLARIVKTLRIIRYWNYTKDYLVLELYRRRITRYWNYTGEGLPGIGTIQEKDYQVLELYREKDYLVLELYKRRITRYWNYTREGLSGTGTIQEKDYQVLELYKEKDYQVLELYRENNYHAVESQNVLAWFKSWVGKFLTMLGSQAIYM